jgi:hypothetical protein
MSNRLPMTQAIALPYCEYQNEPSRPLPMIIDIPDDKRVRDQMLTDLFHDHVMELYDLETLEQVEFLQIIDDPEFGYGDITVCTDGGVYLYITYIKE